MAELDNATGGGDYLDTKPLAQDKTLVVFKVLELLPDRPGNYGVNKPVLADVLICSGPRTGEVHEGGDYILGGITGPLRRAGAGKFVAGVLEIVTKQGRNPFEGLNTASPEQLEKIKPVFKGGDGFKVEHQLANASSAPAANGAAADDEPPF